MAENEERRISGEDPSRELPKEREDVQRPSDTWVPQGVLPEPKPQDGYVFRWIRTTSNRRTVMCSDGSGLLVWVIRITLMCPCVLGKDGNP